MKVAFITTNRADWRANSAIITSLKRKYPGIKVSIYTMGAWAADRILDSEVYAVIGRTPFEKESLITGEDKFGPIEIASEVMLFIAGLIQVDAPDAVVCVGDRTEMLSAALAATICTTPIIHIHGGEVTLGAIDNQCRNAISKLASVHCCATEKARERLMDMGESVIRITRTGAPALDNLASHPSIRSDFLLVTVHPTTLDKTPIETQMDELLMALIILGMPVIFSSPNTDSGGEIITDKIAKEIIKHENWRWVLPTDDFTAYMASCAVMLGNSSAAIIEAPQYNTKVVNIGSRQDGRERVTEGIRDVPFARSVIVSAVRQLLAEATPETISPYYMPNSSERVADVIAGLQDRETLLWKR